MTIFFKVIGVLIAIWLVLDCYQYLHPVGRSKSEIVHGLFKEHDSVVHDITSPSQYNQVQTPPSFTLTAHERRVLYALCYDDYNAWWDNRKHSSTFSRPLLVNAAQMQLDYEQNEVAGDQKYRAKLMAITGTVTSIDRGIGEIYSIGLSGGNNMFIGPRAYMADGFKDYLANLHKGQLVRLVCKGSGMLLGSANVSECMPSDHWTEGQVNAYVNSIDSRISSKDRLATRVVLVSMAISRTLPDSSPCFSGGTVAADICIKDVSTAANNLSTAQLQVAADKLKVSLEDVMGRNTLEKLNR